MVMSMVEHMLYIGLLSSTAPLMVYAAQASHASAEPCHKVKATYMTFERAI